MGDDPHIPDIEMSSGATRKGEGRDFNDLLMNRDGDILDPRKFIADIVEGKGPQNGVAGDGRACQSDGDLYELNYSPAPENSDEALALEYVALESYRRRWVEPRGRWYIDDGCVWREDDSLATKDSVREFLRQKSIIFESNKKLSNELASKKKSDIVENLVRSDRRMAGSCDQWDTDDIVLNTPGGVFSLKEEWTRPARPDDYMTKITAVAPGGKCPRWDWHLDEITGGDEEYQSFLQVAFGLSATGLCKEHAVFYGFGPGGNGKSVTFGTVGGALGSYHRAVPAETFTASSRERHPTDLANLQGARFVTVPEIEEGRRLDEARLKLVSGGDMMSARRMRRDFEEFRPKCKIWMTGNHKPPLRSVDEAIKRRLFLLPFEVVIPKERRDPDLAQKLKEEWPGILAWIIEGARRYHRDGLVIPHIVRAATESYFAAEDMLSMWLDERCERDPDGWEKSERLFASWTEWATAAGETVGLMKSFSQKIEMKGFKPARKKIGRGFAGVRLKSYSQWEACH